ncbi:MAG TPA: ABC transporter ATP-binding protein [Candidatus Limnocylindrales bacterium]|nr:ABC transporter ATP-binding protein [Candidatus Limnocylindrales bacterium]
MTSEVPAVPEVADLPDVPEVKAPALEMRGITKRYPGVVANDGIDLEIRPGEIHALLGENGAGKTTLMNVLYGLARPDEGQILLDGKEVHLTGPSDAIARGISMVHQHFMLVPVLTVAENIVLGEETMTARIFLDRREAHERIVALGRQFGFEVNPEAKVGSLSVGWQQRVEILKALYRDARILVLDEPTAVLTPQETEEIFAVLRSLAAGGHSIVFISHKLYEVLEIADRITVIRRGKVVGERVPSETNEADLAELMVGREVSLTVDRGTSHPADPALQVAGLTVDDDRGSEAVHGVDLEIRGGEILGIAGVAGNGQDELVEALVGLRRPTGGTVSLDGKDITGQPSRAIYGAGVAYVPADRHRFGLVLPFSIADNLVLTSYYREPYARGILRNDAAIHDTAETRIREFDVRTPTADAKASTLSGGNQQKVVVAREFGRDLRLLVLDQPTRGLDVGSIEFIHKQAIAKRDAGTAILLVSAELDEVLELSDRIAVMYRGRIVAVVDGRTADKNEVGLLMATGGREPAAEAVAAEGGTAL